MPESESPQVRWYRVSTVIVATCVCLALPPVVVLVFDVPGSFDERRLPLITLIVGAIVGAIIPFLYWAPFRALGLVGYASIAWLAAAIYGVCTGHWPGWAQGIPIGLMIGAITRGKRGEEPPEDTYRLVAGVLIGAAIAWGFIVNGRPFNGLGDLVLLVAAFVLLWTWTSLFRPVFEITAEPVLWVMYRVRARGPGLKDFPRTGACLVIANHACWFDPLFVAKVLPRPITPMMTSRFYNLPVLRQLMVMFGVISVSETAIKKEAPEIREAIAALDRGECLVVFPEGYLRRNEGQPLRRFGQGVWQVLQARPNTLVFACWVEGGWGSYTSYLNGPPTKNKKLDIARPIGVGVSEAALVPEELLTDHLATRFYLMNLVAAARAHLGLPALPTFERPEKDDGPVNSSDTSPAH